MPIDLIQNIAKNINLIAAQRYLYSRAKKMRTIRVVGSLLVALIIAPLIIVFVPKFTVGLGIFSSIWLVVMFLLSHFENRTIRSAATIQEQFDSTVFRLDWNEFLVGTKVSTEIVMNAKRKYKGDLTELEDWYGKLNDIPHVIGVLVCQRSNLVWDWRLRRYFSWSIIVSLLVLIGLDISIGYYTGITTKDLILALILPSLPAIIIGVRESKEHFEIANAKEALEGRLSKLLDGAIDQHDQVDNTQLRQIQDKIYDLRKKAALIPDWWNDMLENQFEQDMQNSVDIYKERVNKMKL